MKRCWGRSPWRAAASSLLLQPSTCWWAQDLCGAGEPKIGKRSWNSEGKTVWGGEENTLEPPGTSVCQSPLTISNHDELQSVTAAASCPPSKFPNSHKLLIGLARTLNHREGDLGKCNSSATKLTQLKINTVE